MAGGNFGGGNGTEISPYIVEDAADLNAVRNNLGSFYSQSKDIDMSGFGMFTPIGSDSSSSFSGRYDGNGRKITNLSINVSGTNVGLFGYCSGGLSGIHLVGANIKGSDNVGGIAGVASSQYNPISSCSVKGTVTGDVTVGGVVGDCTSYRMERLHFEGTVTSYTGNCGGIAGKLSASNGSTLQDTYSKGKVVGASSGGIAGTIGNRSGVFNGWSSAEVHGSKCAGGIAGTVSGTNAKYIQNCFALNTKIVRVGSSANTSLFNDLYGTSSYGPTISGSKSIDTLEIYL